jgi:DNA-directed RNA polymerase subunit RPC12/RpoP
MRSRTIEFLGHAVGSAVGNVVGSAISSGRNAANNTNNSHNTTNTTIINNYNISSAPENDMRYQNANPVEIDLKCPNCMGERNIDTANMLLICPYCDHRQVIPPDQIEAYRRLNNQGQTGMNNQFNPNNNDYYNNQNINGNYYSSNNIPSNIPPQNIQGNYSNNPPQQNWQPVNSSYNNVQQPAMAVPQGTYSAPYAPQPKKRTWLWVLGWIFIFPVPLTILMLRNRIIPVGVRYAIIAVAWIIYGSLALSGNKNKNDSVQNEISPPTTASSLEGENYEDVEKRFKSSGFKNITFKPMGDLVTGWINEDGEVAKVSINGVTSFSPYDKFPLDAEVVISYHSYSAEEDQNEKDTDASEEEKAS